MTMDVIKEEITRLIGMIAGGASALQMICRVNKDEAAEHIAEDIEEHAWQLLKMLDPEEYEKVLKYNWNIKERQNGN